MFTLKLYNLSGDKYVINRPSSELTLITTKTGELLEELSILNPSFSVELTINEMNSVNYAYIEELQRFYYINDKILLNDKIVQISLNIDILATYTEVAKRVLCRIERCSCVDLYNSEIEDSFLTFSEEDEVIIDYGNLALANNPFYNANWLTSNNYCFIVNYI